MFSLARTPTASSAAKQALMASFPPPTTASSPVMHSPVMPHSPVMHSSPRIPSSSSSMYAVPSSDTRRLTGPLFGPASMTTQTSKTNAPSPGHQGGTGYFQRQAFARAIHASPREGFTLNPSSPRMTTTSPKPALKSCLKSPNVNTKSPMLNGVKSPRFASTTMVIVKSGEGPLWKDADTLTTRMEKMELKEKDIMLGRGQGEVANHMNCKRSVKERVPTPYRDHSEWLEQPSTIHSEPSVDH